MKINHLLKKIIFLSFFLSLFFICALENANAVGVNEPLKFQPQTTIPNLWTKGTEVTLEKSDTSVIASMIKGFYNYGIGIAGILAAIMLMAGGIIWLTSAGSSERVSQAKNLLSGSIIGLVILFGSWIMLRTINPALVDFRIQDVKPIDNIKIGSCCEYNFTKPAKENVSQKDCLNDGGTFFAKAKVLENTNSNLNICVDSGCCKCKIGGSFNTLWASDSNCIDENTEGNKVLPDTCAYACEVAGKAHNLPYESLFSWGKVCSDSGECTFGNGNASSEW